MINKFKNIVDDIVEGDWDSLITGFHNGNIIMFYVGLSGFISFIVCALVLIPALLYIMGIMGVFMVVASYNDNTNTNGEDWEFLSHPTKPNNNNKFKNLNYHISKKYKHGP